LRGWKLAAAATAAPAPAASPTRLEGMETHDANYLPNPKNLVSDPP
jgi:hypothetical protein